MSRSSRLPVGAPEPAASRMAKMVAGAAMWKVAGVSGWAAASAPPAPTQPMTVVRHEAARKA